MHKIVFTLFLIASMFVPLAGVSAGYAAVPQLAPQLATGTGMVDVWVFVDADQNGIFSSGDDGLSDVSACLALGDWLSCVGTDLGDTWWEDLDVGDYVSSIDAASVPVGYELSSIRCEETGSRAEYTPCQYDVNNLTTNFNLLDGKRINIFYALTASAPLIEPPLIETPLIEPAHSRIFLPFLGH